MVGLCATCVADHTKMHHMAQTYPDYENIQQTYQITSAILNEEALKLQKQKVKFVISALLFRSPLNHKFKRKRLKSKIC